MPTIHRKIALRRSRFDCLIAPVIVLLCAAAPPSASAGESAPETRGDPGVHEILLPELTYEGNASCSASDCHAEPEATEQSGQMIGNESNIWDKWDPHSEAYWTLKDEKSKKIAGELGLEDPTASSRCLTCHAMDVPPKRQGDRFEATVGVGCESCHGPAEKWLDPHSKEGWTAEKREAFGAAGLQKKWGLLDTSNLAVRAHTCVGCHLQIDKDMVDAGHPPLEFELYGYNYYATNDDYYRHWEERNDPLIDAKLWAAGQLAGAQSAEAQLANWKKAGWKPAMARSLADLYGAGRELVKKHFGIDHAKEIPEGDFSAESAAAAARDLAAETKQADNARERRVVAFGVTALGSAAFRGRGEQVPSAFWSAYKTAKQGEAGDAYEKAVGKMARLAQR